MLKTRGELFVTNFLSTRPFRPVSQSNPQPCGYTYWQQTALQGYQQAQGCIWSTHIPFQPQKSLVPDITHQLLQLLHLSWKYCPDLTCSPASPQTPFKLLLCGIPNPGDASSLPLTAYCTCRSPFLAGTATAVFKNIFKTKKSDLYTFTFTDLALKIYKLLRQTLKKK